MKILIVSDTHGQDEFMWDVVADEEPIDVFVHCGDIEHEIDDLVEEMGCPCYICAGNNDFMCNIPEMVEFKLGKYKVLLLHGHHYNIYRDQSALFYLAKENEADIVMFGHLHEPIVKSEDGITIVNPGSMTYPRQMGARPSYIIMTIGDGEEPKYEVRYI